LYTLFIKHTYKPLERRKIGKIEKEILLDTFSRLLDNIDYPRHRKENTNIMFKRMMGRAIPSKWEYHTFMGVLTNALEKISKK
jgi:tRNA C32,U32 (ribose-2'-O)-methylase TrmJ